MRRRILIVIAVTALIGLRVALVYSDWSGQQPHPFTTAAPGTVAKLCFDNEPGDRFGRHCDPSSVEPLTSDSLVYHVTRPNNDRVAISISRIEGSAERFVEQLDLGDPILGPGDEFGTFTCGSCSNGHYVARAYYGVGFLASGTLFAEGFFTILLSS
jgi:hypothetical protein